ncbi:hypothetical protein C7974DRAFT_379896 [Boeremia exigua]|uniref:uncharacterized protein n=1 Tax=Boeremia exigua TaxID=749465 RepID=UPI001E8CE5FF|nr:uncharacterized protein C7974DRAFT_379896 [Boeremia exigua]KAH6615005.1 hypothetical protein C7974DRAFT_379896 [Boeremia exigua]
MNLASGARILALLRLAAFATAQTPSASFAYPPAESTDTPRLTINVLDTVKVEWVSNYAQTWLYLWCDEYKAEDGGARVTYEWFSKEVFASGDTTYTPWDALESDTNNRTGKFPYACHFDLVYDKNQRSAVSGPNLNITSREGETIATTFGRRATQISTTVPTSTSSSSVTSTVSQTASSGTATNSISPPPSVAKDGLSTGAKAGIAIGAVFAVIALAAVGYLFYRNHRRIKELEARSLPQGTDTEPKATPTEYYRQNYQPVPPSELGQHPTYELPAQPQELSGVEAANKQR